MAEPIVNAESMLHAGSMLRHLDMYPYFDFAHYVLSCLMVKDDLSISEFSLCTA